MIEAKIEQNVGCYVIGPDLPQFSFYNEFIFLDFFCFVQPIVRASQCCLLVPFIVAVLLSFISVSFRFAHFIVEEQKQQFLIFTSAFIYNQQPTNNNQQPVPVSIWIFIFFYFTFAFSFSFHFYFILSY